MIKKYNDFINEGIVDLLSGYSMDEVKDKLNHLTPLERFNQLKKLNLTYQDVYTQDEIDNFTGIDKIYASNKYDWVDKFINGKAIVELNNKCGFIDENGNVIIPIKYDDISLSDTDFIRVRLNDKWGLIDKSLKEITPIKYDVIFLFNKGIAKVEINKKYGYINEIGEEIIPAIFNWCQILENDIIMVSLNGKIKYFDKYGKVYNKK